VFVRGTTLGNPAVQIIVLSAGLGAINAAANSAIEKSFMPDLL
jgi:hypothetical protein